MAHDHAHHDHDHAGHDHSHGHGHAHAHAGHGHAHGPVDTGDWRYLVGLLVNLAFVAVSEQMVTWFGLASEPSIWISFVVSMLVLVLILRKG